MKTIPVRIIISLVAVAMVVALYSAVHADSISFGTPYWVTSNWSNSTSPPRGAQASPNNDGIACPGGSVQTGWRIIVDSANGSSPYSGSEYGTQCRQPSLAVTTGARTWVTSNWSNSTTPTYGARASNNDGITCPGGSIQTGWRIVAIDPGMGVYEYGTQCQPLVSSITLDTPYWVISNSSSGSTPTGARASSNDGITCPNGSVQTGWRIIYTSWNDAYAPEGSGGGYDSYEYGTQCRPISSTVIPPPPPPPSSCNTNTAIYNTPGSYTFTVPPGVTQIRTVAIGGGGGGGAGAGGWGSGGGGGCGGALTGGTMTVTPGQQITLQVGSGGAGGNGIDQCPIAGFPWCGTYSPAEDGSPGGDSRIGTFVARGGSWGRTGFYNLYNQHAGGTGGGSGGGGGGNGWPGFYGQPGWGGTAGGQTNSQGSGGYCTGDGWSIDPGSFIKKVSYAAGEGGYAPPPRRPGINFYGPGNYVYWGGGGGGGLVVNGFPTRGGDGQSSPGNGGEGYGAGGGGSNLDNKGAGGAGASGAVYIEWDGGGANSCTLSCSVTFDQNPLTTGSTVMRWTSTGLTGSSDTFLINGVGYVGASGAAQVHFAGDYSGTVTNVSGTMTCPATLTASSCSSSVQYCNATTGNLVNNCGQTTTTCPYGCSTQTNRCHTTCQPRNVCNADGTKVVNSCTGAVVKDCSRTGQMCVAGQCISPPIGFEEFDATNVSGNTFRATGHLQVAPSLVKKGDTTRVFWNVAHAASCTVLGSNGDGALGSGTGIWNMFFSGVTGKTTSAIMAKTTYTLLCRSLEGATPPTVQETATVNVLPSFQEL